MNSLSYGDEVHFGKHICVILDKFQLSDKIYRYTVFAPDLGVYTAFTEELKFIRHIPEADELLKVLSTDALEQTA